MARRFLTAEDVRRAGAGDIEVDPGTLVTPQAQEEARQRGVAIRTAGGDPWTEPVPDRGPDAERGQAALPNLPEPRSDELGPTGVVVTAVGRDRPGVLAEIAAAIGGLKGNVHDISQKTVGEYFHLILTVELPPGTTFHEIQAALESLGGEDDYALRVMHERVFRFMHRI